MATAKKKTNQSTGGTVLSQADLGYATLARQMLLERKKLTVPKALEQLLAVQAQWPKPPFIALHARLAGFQREHLASAAKSYDVVRGTGFRGTIFLLNPKDYALFRGSIVATLEAAVKSLVKTDMVAEKDQAKIVKLGRELFKAKARAFNDLRDELAKKAPKGTANDIIRRQAFLIRMRLPLLQVPTDVPWGWHAACDFGLAEDLIDAPIDDTLQHDALVLRYLAALGPASVADAQNFLGMGKLKDAFERLRPKLVTFTNEAGKELFDLPNAPRPKAADSDPAPVRFLPDFDNIVMGHQDRTRFVSEEHKPYIYLKGLVVNRTYLIEGRVAGTWKVDVVAKKHATLVVEPFAAIPKKWKAEVEKEAETLVRFFEPDAKSHGITIAKPKT